MTYVFETSQTNLNASNVSKELRAVADGLEAAGHVVVLADRFERYWRWRQWKTPIAANHFVWQQLQKDPQ